ncbi:MAG: hypothetical protein ACM3S2_00010 [Ignavibacteriales bacterium]
MKILLLLAAATFLIGCSSLPKETRDCRSWLYYAKKWEPEYLQKDSGGNGVIFRFYGERYPVNIIQDEGYNFWSYPLDTVVAKYTAYGYIEPSPDAGTVDLTYIYYQINNTPLSTTIKADSADTRKYSDLRYQLRDYSLSFSLKTDSTDKYTVELPPNTYLLTRQSDYYDYRYGLLDRFLMKDLIVKQGYWSIVKIVFHREQVLTY